MLSMLLCANRVCGQQKCVSIDAPADSILRRMNTMLCVSLCTQRDAYKYYYSEGVRVDLPLNSCTQLPVTRNCVRVHLSSAIFICSSHTTRE